MAYQVGDILFWQAFSEITVLEFFHEDFDVPLEFFLVFQFFGKDVFLELPLADLPHRLMLEVNAGLAHSFRVIGIISLEEAVLLEGCICDGVFVFFSQ